MRELSLKELQDISLGILLDIHTFCLENGIKYSLAYGTLLGAVRHQGWIPWDDDIDIVMTRTEWEKFSKSYHSKNGYILKSNMDTDSFIVYPRVYDTKRSIAVSPYPYGTRNYGVWIDIFIVDGLPNDGTSNKYKFFNLNVLFYKRTLYFRSKIHYGESNSIKFRIAKFFRPFFIKAINICKKAINNSGKKYKLGESQLCACLDCPDSLERGMLKTWSSKDFKDYRFLLFEGHQLMAASGYNNILQATYGDYMQLPPKEEQVRKHSKHLFYKRNK